MPDWTGLVTAADACSVLDVVQDPLPGTVVTGSFTVTFTATDGVSTTACSFPIALVDTIAPTLACPTNKNRNDLNNDCAQPVLWPIPIPVDGCGAVAFTQTDGLPSGSLFPIGTDTIVYMAMDAAGNTSTCSFTVTVWDISPPSVIALYSTHWKSP
ncbi:MAG: HYR domain-containing protein [Flavobacteriales bacterium]|nr:HYR domain-containing protein [Flavobacteriales bacterium]